MASRSAPDRGRVRPLTGATDEIRPSVCQTCTFWQTRLGTRPVDRARWIEDVETEFGAWGALYVEDGRQVASLQYGPAAAFPRAVDMPAGPPSADAVLVTCAYLTDPTSPWALQSLFLACIGEARDRRASAVEAFAYRHAPDAAFATRFLVHRTIFPRDFLADFGFYPLRAAGNVELMRLELGGLVPVEEPESVLALALRKARDLVVPPAPAPL